MQKNSAFRSSTCLVIFQRGVTALHVSAVRGYGGVVSALLDAGAVIDAKSDVSYRCHVLYRNAGITCDLHRWVKPRSYPPVRCHG